MKKEHYIRLSGFKSIIVSKEDDGLALSVHVLGGNLMVTLDQYESLELFRAVYDVLEDESCDA